MTDQDLRSSIRGYVEFLMSFVESNEGIIDGRSCGPAQEIVEHLRQYGIDVRYIKGAKVVTIEGRPIQIITPEMAVSHGSIFLTGFFEEHDSGDCIPYSRLITELAMLVGAGKKVAPFMDPEAISLFLLNWYWAELKRILEISMPEQGVEEK